MLEEEVFDKENFEIIIKALKEQCAESAFNFNDDFNDNNTNDAGFNKALNASGNNVVDNYFWKNSYNESKGSFVEINLNSSGKLNEAFNLNANVEANFNIDKNNTDKNKKNYIVVNYLANENKIFNRLDEESEINFINNNNNIYQKLKQQRFNKSRKNKNISYRRFTF